jgi:hypothetical protein
MAISSSTLLAIIGNKYVVGNKLPKLQYRTLCDRYVDFCFFLQIVSIASFMLIYELSFYEVEDVGNLGSLMNEVAFSFQLIATIYFHHWMMMRLNDHALDMETWQDVLKTAEERQSAKKHRPLRKVSDIVGCKFIAISNNYRLDLVKHSP